MHFAEERISVCPHDTAKNQLAWFTFNTWLQRKLGVRLHFEPQSSFLTERQCVLDDPRYRLVYANPFSAAQFHQQLGFIPVARPAKVYDETFLVKRAGVALPENRPWRIASATDKLIIHTLGLMLLKELGVGEEGREFVFVGTHVAAANAVLHDKADVAFVYNETWYGLNESTRVQFETVKVSDTQRAYHCFCLSPVWRERLDEVRRTLCQMHEEDSGRRILSELKFERFEPLEENALDELAAIIAMFA